MIIILRCASFIFAMLGILFFLFFKKKELKLKTFLDTNRINFFLIFFWISLILSVFAFFEGKFSYYDIYLFLFSLATFIIAMISIIFLFFYEKIRDKIFVFFYKDLFLNIKILDILNIFWVLFFLFLFFVMY